MNFEPNLAMWPFSKSYLFSDILLDAAMGESPGPMCISQGPPSIDFDLGSIPDEEKERRKSKGAGYKKNPQRKFIIGMIQILYLRDMLILMADFLYKSTVRIKWAISDGNENGTDGASFQLYRFRIHTDE